MNISGTANHLFCFGMGFSAKRLARHAFLDGWQAAGTARTPEGLSAIAAAGAQAYPFDRARPVPKQVLSATTHLLVSIPPDDRGDPVIDLHAEDIASITSIVWIGYLSSTGVYGDTGGKPVDETAPLRPTSARAERRAAAERAWIAFGRARSLPVHIFRLASIYGPGRSAIDQVRNGTARRIDKPNHLFSRIHVEDITRVLKASMSQPHPGAIYNVCDDEPAAAADVIFHAAELMGVAPPPLVSFEAASAEMSPMALSFWRDNRRVVNGRIKDELGVTLRYPDYRKGLKTILGTGG